MHILGLLDIKQVLNRYILQGLSNLSSQTASQVLYLSMDNIVFSIMQCFCNMIILVIEILTIIEQEKHKRKYFPQTMAALGEHNNISHGLCLHSWSARTTFQYLQFAGGFFQCKSLIPITNCHSPTQPQHELESIMGRNPQYNLDILHRICYL